MRICVMPYRKRHTASTGASRAMMVPAIREATSLNEPISVSSSPSLYATRMPPSSSHFSEWYGSSLPTTPGSFERE